MSLVRGRDPCCRNLRLLNVSFSLEVFVQRVVGRWGQLMLGGGGGLRVVLCKFGPGSSVTIATGYGLGGPGSKPGGDNILRPSRPALGPTQPPVKWVADLDL